MKHLITLPCTEKSALRVGDIVYLTGKIYTMRDSAHLRALEYLKEGKELPFNPKDSAIWHCGPIVKDGKILVAGSTTSSRLNNIQEEVMKKLGFRFIIGKGGMSGSVVTAIKELKGAYFASVGGAAAFYGEKIEGIEKVHWEDMGMASAVWELKVKDFGPLIVAIDSKGNNLYE